MTRVWDYVRLRPLLWFVPPFCAGVALGGPLDRVWAAAIGAAALALAVLARGGWRVAAAALAGFALGALRVERATPPPEVHVDTEIVARVVRPSQRIHFRRTPLSDTGERHGGRERTVVVVETDRGRLRLQTDADVELFGGETIRATGTLKSAPEPANPGQFDRRAWLARQGIVGVFEAKDLRVETGPSGFLSHVHRARRAIRARLHASAKTEAAALATALLIGDREGLDDSFTLDLQRTGTTHFLAVSGFNVALVAGALWVALVMLGVAGRWRTAALLAGVWIYTLLTGLEVSVLRAAIMASIWLFADLVGRRRDSMSSVAAAALLILAVDPRQIHDVGFQLSFLAVLGILALVPIFATFLAAERRWHQKLCGVVLVSLSAWLATAPVVQNTFHLLTPCVLLTNVLFCPLILAMMLVAVLALVAPPAGALVDLAYRALAALAHLIPQIPGSTFFVPAIPPALVLLYYAGFLIWSTWIRVSPARWKVLFAAVLVVPLAVPAFRHRRPEGLRVAVLDVGRGACVYVEFPDGRNFVYDAGSLDYRDPGASIAAPYLWSRGVFRVDTLVLSHSDSDHTNGAASILERFRVRTLVVPRGFEDAEILAFARTRGVEIVEVERLGPPQELAPGIEILGPPLPRPAKRNDASVVLRVDRRVLLTGDIMEEGSQALEGVPDLRADVWLVPHHGHYQRRHADLARRVAPRVSVVPGRPEDASVRVVRGLDPVFYAGVELTIRGDDVRIVTFR